jgi:hypothetical protein
MHRVSGDFLQIAGSTRTYFGSFVVDSPTITTGTAGEVIRGLGRFTFAAGAPVVQVTIARRRIFQPPAPATVQFFTTTGQPGATYVCNYNSAYFRSVTLQTEHVSDVTDPVFTSYNTGSLLSGGPARNLSVVAAYAEAGLQIMPVAPGPVIDISEAGTGGAWSEAEMMASMKKHFARIAAVPHWDMWQMVGWRAELPGLLGIMFDSNGRQGCAVFYALMSGIQAPQLRQKLFAHVHELGHAFNLMHSWQKSLASPPAGVNNPGALSWMNYPQLYQPPPPQPGGTDAFWKAFPFQFINDELVHLRHAFRNNIEPVTNPFTIGAAEIDPELMSGPIEDLSGLEFAISGTQPHYLLGEPVVLDLRLRSFDRRGRVAHSNLHPNSSGVSVAILRPDGRALLFQPLVDRLVPTEPQLLAHDGEFAETAYIGYGKRGLYFGQPGVYRVRAIYHAPDGSRVFSNVAQIRVRYPASSEDNEVAELMIGNQQGELFALRGSDDSELSDGNKALDEVISKYAKHPLAVHAQHVKGFNLARTFKIIDHMAPGSLTVRKPDLQNAQSLLSAAAAAASRLDNISKAQALERLAAAQNAAGDTAAAGRAEQEATRLRGPARR